MIFDAALLLIIAGWIIAIQLIRSVRLDSENTARSARANGFRFFLGWFIAGGSVALVTFVMFVIAGIGGVSAPPDIWMLFRMLGLFVLPPVLTLGGVPAAIQITHGKAWKKSALIALAVCAISWLILVGVVFFGPTVFGWSW